MKIVLLTHAQLVREILRNAIDQLKRDRISFKPGLKVSFTALGTGDVEAGVSVFINGEREPIIMKGRKKQLLDVASNLAILELGAESRRYLPKAVVHLWMVNVTDGNRDYISAEVQLEERPHGPPAA